MRADTGAQAAAAAYTRGAKPGGRLLEVHDLRVAFDTQAAKVDGVSFAVAQNEVVALVGESGSGKSLTALSLLGLTRHLGARVTGIATLQGAELIGASESELRHLRGGRVAMVFQDPLSSLNPVMRVGEQIAEQIRAHEPDAPRAQALMRATELLERVGIERPGERVRAFPHELSGGMRQRVMIAMALSCLPLLLIADEPTTALDVTTQERILDLLEEQRARAGAGLLLVTHDLAVAAARADRILVMRAGRLIEQGPAEEIVSAPQHPYTEALLAAFTARIPRTARAPGPVLLEARELRMRFPRARSPAPAPALDGVTLTLHEGETLAVVGESGSGKTTLLRCLIALRRPDAGAVLFAGADVTRAGRRALEPVRRELQMVFQDPQSALNPRRRVDWILASGLRLRGVPRAQRRERARELLERVGLGEEHLGRYPHELSGGERQRVGIARALSSEPRALLLDEPVSSLDASLRAQVLALLVRLQEELGLSYLLIAHDLRVVRDVSDRVAVMRAGRVVEVAPTAQLFAAPSHPYTQTLLAAAGLGGEDGGRDTHRRPSDGQVRWADEWEDARR
jgi:peptide/nickel transport system ATP-binding protein